MIDLQRKRISAVSRAKTLNGLETPNAAIHGVTLFLKRAAALVCPRRGLRRGSYAERCPWGYRSVDSHGLHSATAVYAKNDVL